MKCLFSAALLSLLTSSLQAAATQPERYATPQTRTIIEQMIEAHGAVDPTYPK